MDREISLGNIYFGKSGTSVPRIKRFLKDTKQSLTPDTLWLADDVSTTDSAKKHVISLVQDSDVFETPKPEKLISRILTIATNEGDLVLDPYLGSGTTCAVAHKMGRPYIGIEDGDHALTHCVVRMKRVVEGESGGVSSELDWIGGGGFDFFEFADKSGVD